jgi:hypothetical protein
LAGEFGPVLEHPHDGVPRTLYAASLPGPSNRLLMLRKERSILRRLGDVSGKVFPEKVRSGRLAE